MNKKTIIGIICIVIIIAIIGAIYFLTGNNSNENNANQTINDSNVNLGNAGNSDNATNDENQTGDTTNEGLKTLVVYFSVPETSDPNNMTRDEENSTVIVDGEVLGNTQYVAQLIGENTGGDVFRLEPVDAYPTNHDDLLQRAADEMRSLEQYNFDGKTVVPFCTHGGSGLSGTPRTIADKLPNSTVIQNGFTLSRTNMESAPSEVESWLQEIYN